MGHPSPALDYLLLLDLPLPSRLYSRCQREREAGRLCGSRCQNCSRQWGTKVGARVLSPAPGQAMPQGSTQGQHGSLVAARLGSPGSVPTCNPPSL